MLDFLNLNKSIKFIVMLTVGYGEFRVHQKFGDRFSKDKNNLTIGEGLKLVLGFPKVH